MTKGFSTSRRNFLRGAAAAAGAVTLGGVLETVAGPAQRTQAAPIRPDALYASNGSVSVGTAAANLVNPALSAMTQTIVLHTPHVVKEIAPGVPYELWTFEGTAPGPHLHVTEGVPVDFTLINDSGVMGHSIDFHAALLPWNKYYQMVEPGKQLSFTWTPQYPGVFLYHCGTPPVLMHIANGMHGAIVVEPKNGWPEKADREYVLVQEEFYPGDPDEKGVHRGDINKMNLVQPDYVTFNGYANQYQAAPLAANPGELVRVYICNAGPTLFSAFHVIGTLFTASYPDGNPSNKQVGSQTVTVPPGGAYAVEMRIPDEGLYPFVTHSFAYTGRGALGLFKVGNPPPLGSGAAH
jgi:nitrite reductase (NO-forming)